MLWSTTRNRENVRFSLLDLNRLAALNDVEGVGERACFDTRALVADVTIGTSLDSGSNTVVFPEAFRNVPDFMTFVSSAEASVQLWVVSPSSSTVTVHPNWFNNGGYDFGYQWLTR
jgi:hypothetical protein